MARLPVIDKVFRAAFEWIGANGETAANVMHFRSALAGQVAADVATAIGDSVSTNLWRPVASSAYVQRVMVTPLDGTSPTYEYDTGAPGSPWSGAGSGDSIPQSAALIKLTTDLRGRSYRGRVFLPFVSEGVQSSGTISSSVLTDWLTAITDFQDALQADDTGHISLTWVVASYKHSTAAPVVTARGEALCGTQRRRMTRLR